MISFFFKLNLFGRMTNGNAHLYEALLRKASISPDIIEHMHRFMRDSIDVDDALISADIESEQEAASTRILDNIASDRK